MKYMGITNIMKNVIPKYRKVVRKYENWEKSPESQIEMVGGKSRWKYGGSVNLVEYGKIIKTYKTKNQWDT